MGTHGGPAYAEMEKALLTVEIALTRRPGRYVARISFDDQAGWQTCEARSARLAFEQATALAARRVPAPGPPEPTSAPDDGAAPSPTQIWSRKPEGRGRPPGTPAS